MKRVRLRHQEQKKKPGRQRGQDLFINVKFPVHILNKSKQINQGTPDKLIYIEIQKVIILIWEA